MDKKMRLVVLTAAGSAFCWWPFFILSFIRPTRNPSPFGFVVCLVFIAFVAGFSTARSGGRWLRYTVVSGIAAFVGICVGGMIWPSDDGIAQSYLLYAAAVGAGSAALVSLFTGLTVWLALGPDRRTC